MAEKVIGLRIEVKGTQAQIKRVGEISQELRKLRKDQTDLEKSAQKLENRNKTGTREYARLQGQIRRNTKANAELREEQRRANQVLKANAQAAATAKGSYEGLVAENRVLTLEAKRLSDPLGKNSKEFANLTTRIKNNTSQLKQLDSAMGRQFRNVGNYKEAVQGAVASFAKLAAGITAAIFVFRQLNRIFGDSIRTIADFQQANANLATILGKTRDEIGELTNDAERLGATTARTASEVTSLQEAYARLGFTQKEIIDLTEDTINGSVSLNAELDQTAELVGAVVNSFDDLGTQDAALIIDQLTAATNNSALNFQKLQSALPVVAGAANAAGVPFSRLLALLGKLSDSGIDASTSATALRNIFIESAAQGDSYDKILESIVRNSDKLTASTDEFGKRAAVSAATLANNIEATDELNRAIDEAGGTAQRVADERLNTLNGAVTLLGSAWEGLILSVDRGDGSFTQIATRVVQVSAEILKLITGIEKSVALSDFQEKETRRLAETFIAAAKAVAVATAGYVAYRVALVATTFATSAASAATAAWSTVVGLVTGKIRIATVAQQAFNAATRANPIGLLIAALTAGAAAFGLFSEKAEEAGDTLDQEFIKRLEETKQKIEELDAAMLSSRRKAELLRLAFRDTLRGITAEDLKTTLRLAEDALAESLRTQNVVRSRSSALSAKQEIEFRKQTIDNINKEIALREKERRELEEDKEKKSKEKQAKDTIDIERNILDLVDRMRDARRAQREKDIDAFNKRKAEADKRAEETLIRNLRGSLQGRQRALDQALEDELISRKAHEEQIKIIEDERKSRQIKKREDDAKLLDEVLAASIEATQIISDTIFELQSQALERETKGRLAEIKKRNETETTILNEQLRDNIISETEFREQKTNLDKRFALEELRQRKKAFEQQKELAIVQSIINTALAIGSVWANNGGNPIVAAILSGVAAAAGIAQTAIIASQEFEDGGKVAFPAKGGGVIEGPSHDNGGVKFHTQGVPMEAEGGEVILNRVQQARAGGDAFFAKLGVPGFQAFQAGGRIPKFQNGSRIPVPVIDQPLPPLAQDRIGLNEEQIIEGFGEVINDQEVVVSEQAITETQNEVETQDAITDF